MDVLEQLRTHSSEFVWSSKIAVRSIEGRGNSVTCAEPLAPHELIIHVPASMLINVSTVSLSGENNLTPHEVLALELLRRRDEGDDAWVRSLPSEFPTMPVSWSPEHQRLLPPRYLNRVQEQAREMCEFASKCSLPLKAAQWAWMAVNTRCLYWHQGGMTLAPAIDYLNHTCKSEKPALSVKPTQRGISVYTQSAHRAGEELTFCYGPHENGFLLVEYGFVVAENPWSFADISEMVTPFAEGHHEWLTENNYWGDWTVDATGQPSFRVEVALASAQALNTRVLNALIGGYDDGARFAAKTQETLKLIASELCKRYRSLCSDISTSNETPSELLTLYNEQIAILSKLVDSRF